MVASGADSLRERAAPTKPPRKATTAARVSATPKAAGAPHPTPREAEARAVWTSTSTSSAPRMPSPYAARVPRWKSRQVASGEVWAVPAASAVTGSGVVRDRLPAATSAQPTSQAAAAGPSSHSAWGTTAPRRASTSPFTAPTSGPHPNAPSPRRARTGPQAPARLTSSAARTIPVSTSAAPTARSIQRAWGRAGTATPSASGSSINASRA